jgi:hypothetical protein
MEGIREPGDGSPGSHRCLTGAQLRALIKEHFKSNPLRALVGVRKKNMCRIQEEIAIIETSNPLER